MTSWIAKDKKQKVELQTEETSSQHPTETINEDALAQTLEKQIGLIAELEEGLGNLFDMLVDSESVLEEEVIDDTMGIGDMKRGVADLLKKVTEWKETQNAELQSST